MQFVFIVGLSLYCRSRAESSGGPGSVHPVQEVAEPVRSQSPERRKISGNSLFLSFDTAILYFTDTYRRCHRACHVKKCVLYDIKYHVNFFVKHEWRRATREQEMFGVRPAQVAHRVQSEL